MYPIVQDNEYATWKAYENRYWPAKYLIDKNGRIRYTHFEEGKYDETEQMIQTLVQEIGQDVSVDTIDNPEYTIDTQSPETYLGYARIEGFASPQAIVKNSVQSYSLPAQLGKNQFAFSGEWEINEEYARPQAGAQLKYNFDATNVFLVMRPVKNGESGKIMLRLDGESVTKAQSGADVRDSQTTIDADKLYHLIKLDNRENHVLTIQFLDAQVEVFAFTFG